MPKHCSTKCFPTRPNLSGLALCVINSCNTMRSPPRRARLGLTAGVPPSRITQSALSPPPPRTSTSTSNASRTPYIPCSFPVPRVTIQDSCDVSAKSRSSSVCPSRRKTTIGCTSSVPRGRVRSSSGGTKSRQTRSGGGCIRVLIPTQRVRNNVTSRTIWLNQSRHRNVRTRSNRDAEKKKASKHLFLSFFTFYSSDMVGEDLRDDVCLVIDMECFRVDGVYRCRELGYCSWRGDSGRVAITPRKRRSLLTKEEKQQANFLSREIHGLTYTPDVRESPQHFSVKLYTERLYAECVTEHRRRVAFKGGHVERDMLYELNIPFLDLETLGCPKYDILRGSAEDEETCGWHAIPNKHHCAMAECVAFFKWYNDYLYPPMDVDADDIEYMNTL